MKKTVTPQNWKKVPIKSVYSGFYDGVHGTPKPADEGPVFLGIKNLTDDGHLDCSDIRHIAEEDFPKWVKRVEPRAGDIVFTYEATLNRYAIIPEGFRGCLGRRLALIRPDNEKVDTRFLFYYFFGKEWRDTIAKNMILGATVERVPIISFPKFEISLPPLPTQRKIAAILFAYDDLIENNTRRIKILEEMAQMLYREWFVNFRFPGHEKARMVKTKLGQVPEGWEVITLDEIMDFQGGAQPPKSEWIYEPRDGYVRMIQIRDYESDAHICYVQDSDNLRKCNRDEIMIARYGASVARICSGLEGAYNVALVKVIPAKSNLREFLRCYLRSQLFQELLIGMSARTAQAGFNKTVLTSISLCIPKDSTLFEKFEKTVVPIMQQTLTLEAKNANLRRTRDLLLPKLIAGEVEV